MLNSRIGLVSFVLVLAIIVGVMPATAQIQQEKTAGYYEIQVVKGNLALKEGNFDEALSTADGVLADQPDNAEAIAIRSRALFSLGRGSEAVEGFRKLESRNLADQSWRVAYGITLRSQGDDAGAKVQFEKAAKAHPGNGAANYHLGLSLYNEKNYGRAAGYFDKSLEAKFNVAAAHYYRGRCAQESNDTTKARASYQAATAAGASGQLAADNDRALASLDSGEAPVEEAGGFKANGRLGYAYDTNVILNPASAANDSTTGLPFGGSQDDGRIETMLDFSYLSEGEETNFGGGYRFNGYWQLGQGKATTDFTLLSHDLNLVAQNQMGDDVVMFNLDGILTTLGRIPSASGVSTGLRHEIFNVQVILDATWLHPTSETTVLGAFAQYSRDFRPEDPLGNAGALPNGIFDADLIHAGFTLTHDLRGPFRDGSQLTASASFFARFNENDPTSGTVLTAAQSGAVSMAARYLGPRLRAGISVVAWENVTLGTDIFYGLEYRYDSKDPAAVSGVARSSNEVDHRLIGNLKGQYDFTENLAVSVGYRWEVMVTNINSIPPAIDPDYDRQVVSVNLLFQN